MIRKNWKSYRVDTLIILSLLILVAGATHILARKHLEFGFFIDDWIFLSQYMQVVSNPILDSVNAWIVLRSHTFAHAYYIGILHYFFGLNYFSYHLFNEILKIIATVSIYPLIFFIFKNRLLAILTTLIYGIHFAPYGTLDNASRGEDFIAVIFMSVFLIAYIHVVKKAITKFWVIVGMAVFLFATLFIDPTRMFPLIVLLPLIELIFIFSDKKKFKTKIGLKRLAIIFFPFIVLYLISPDAINSQLFYFDGLYQKLRTGNLQLLTAPFASFGSMFISPELSVLLSRYLSTQSLSDFLVNFIFSLYLVFMVINILIGSLFTSNSQRFIIMAFVINFLMGLLAFLLATSWYGLDQSVKAGVDPGSYFTQALFGFLIFSLALNIFLNRNYIKSEKIYSVGILSALVFSLIFIVLTWIWADINSIFMGVHAYFNIPAIGSSLFFALVLFLIFKRFRKIGILITITFFVLFFRTSYMQTDKYFSYWLDNGLRAEDQSRIYNQFWKEVGYQKHFGYKDLPDYLPLFYLDTSEDYKNGLFYDLTIIHKIPSFILARSNEADSGRLEYCDSLILEKKELQASIKQIDGKKVLYRDKCGRNIVYKLDNFYAFKLKDRNITSIKEEITQELGLEYEN